MESDSRFIRGRRRLGRPLLALLAIAAIAVAVVAVASNGRTPKPTRQSAGPALVTAGQVAAPLLVRVLPVATYCAAPQMRLVPCQPGQRPVIAQPQRLLELSFTARRAAGTHSWYAWDLAAPRPCSQASDGGPTRGAVQAGTRLVFDDLIPPDCRGTITARVLYVTQASSADQERYAQVGRSSLELR